MLAGTAHHPGDEHAQYYKNIWGEGEGSDLLVLQLGY